MILNAVMACGVALQAVIFLFGGRWPVQKNGDIFVAKCARAIGSHLNQSTICVHNFAGQLDFECRRGKWHALRMRLGRYAVLRCISYRECKSTLITFLIMNCRAFCL